MQGSTSSHLEHPLYVTSLGIVVVGEDLKHITWDEPLSTPAQGFQAV